jgi:hypothetical protein
MKRLSFSPRGDIRALMNSSGDLFAVGGIARVEHQTNPRLNGSAILVGGLFAVNQDEAIARMNAGTLEQLAAQGFTVATMNLSASPYPRA